MANDSTMQDVSKLTLREAYSLAVNDKESYKIMGFSRVRKYQLQQNLRNGKWPKEATMREHLIKSGWAKLQDEFWEKPAQVQVEG